MNSPGARPGKVITFYSYKGGTGRSMTLANIAWILASNGYQVLAADWDLEAPGLHRYFHPFLLDPELTDTPGVIDMVWDVAAAAMDPQTPDLPDWFKPYSDVLNYAVSLRRKFPSGGTLDLLPAGRQGKLYSTRVGAFDWTNFYDRLGGGAFIEAVGASMRAEYDYTLIDSRTGLSDTSGICTVQLPDTLVIGFTFNTQSVSGAAAVAESAQRQRETLRIYPVPMRVEEGERPKLERGRDFARVRFHDLPTGLTDADRRRYWGEVEIPYRTFYAYEEILAPIGDRPGITNSVVSACERLAAHITEGDVRESVPLDESERRRLLSQLERDSTQGVTATAAQPPAPSTATVQDVAPAGDAPAAAPTPAADAVLQHVWRRQRQWSLTAGQTRTRLDRWRTCNLLLLVTAAVLGALAVGTPMPAAAKAAASVAAAVALALAGIVQTTALNAQQMSRWIDSRGASEALKSEIYRYLARVAPYATAERNDLLQKKLDAIQTRVAHVSRDAPLAAPDTNPLPQIEGFASYITGRAQDQADWHRRSSAEHRRQYRSLSFWQLAATVIGAVLAAVGAALPAFQLGAWTAAVTTVAATIGTHLAAVQHQKIAASYAATADELDRLIHFARTADTPEHRKRFVDDVESTITAQDTTWSDLLSAK